MKNGAEQERRLRIPHGSFCGDPPPKVTAAAPRPAPPRKAKPTPNTAGDSGDGGPGGPLGGMKVAMSSSEILLILLGAPCPSKEPKPGQGWLEDRRGQGGECGSLVPRSPERPPGGQDRVFPVFPGDAHGSSRRGEEWGAPSAEQRCPPRPQPLLQPPGLSFPLLCSLGTAALCHHP